MGNTTNTRITALREELGKKVDEAKTKIEETILDRTLKTETDKPGEKNVLIPRISILSVSSNDLLDDKIIDETLRGDVEISSDNLDGISIIQKETEDGFYSAEIKSNNVTAVEVDSKDSLSNNNNTSERTEITINTNGSIVKSENEEELASSNDNYKKKKKKKKEVACVDDVCFSIEPVAKDIASYCVSLLQVRFCGQTNIASSSDTSDTKDVLNLGLYLKLVDKFLHQFENVEEFTGNEEEYLRLLKLVSLKRKHDNETTNQCFQRILADSYRFVKIYHKRGVPSERLQHKKFWGSRQQMLSGKVIADRLDPEGGPLDPIFGVILQPTAGRVGPGDSGWIHNFLFDDCGYMSYHSAVHDAFGYLVTYHDIGPGYNYLSDSRLDKLNPLSGQIAGVKFWKEVINGLEKKQMELECIEI